MTIRGTCIFNFVTSYENEIIVLLCSLCPPSNESILDYKNSSLCQYLSLNIINRQINLLSTITIDIWKIPVEAARIVNNKKRSYLVVKENG